MGLATEILNSQGLYTKAQMERVDRNNSALWDYLCSAHATMATYSEAIDRVIKNLDKAIESGNGVDSCLGDLVNIKYALVKEAAVSKYGLEGLCKDVSVILRS